MFLLAMQCAFRRTLAVVLAGALTATGWAQTAAQPNPAAPEGPKPHQFVVSDYSRPQSPLPQSDRALPVAESAGTGPEQHRAD